jgi:hypothetical protein
VRLQPLGHLSLSSEAARNIATVPAVTTRPPGASRGADRPQMGTLFAPVCYQSATEETQEDVMGRGLLLWLIGIPLPIILLIWLLGGLHG